MRTARQSELLGLEVYRGRGLDLLRYTLELVSGR